MANDSVRARDQHRCLTEMLDPMTTARLAQTGVTAGWHCLDVGAGGGSVAVCRGASRTVWQGARHRHQTRSHPRVARVGGDPA